MFKSNISFTKIIILGIRLLGIGSRFLLAFLLAKEISLEFQGEYSLLATSVTILVIILGLDFYVYSNRQIIKGTNNIIYCLKNSLAFYFLSYSVFFPIIWGVFTIFSVDIISLPLLLCLIMFEHLGQELFRSYIALEKQLLANILLFVRTGLWCFILVVGFLFFKPFKVNLNDIILIWLLSAIVCAIIGFSFFPEIKLIFKTKLNKDWINRGYKVGMTMFFSTICLKVIEYSDRYIIALFMSKKELGIYSLYFQLSNIINVVIFTMYISFVYPQIIKGVYEEDLSKVKNGQKTIINKTILIASVFAIGSMLFLPFFLEFINKEEMYNKAPILYIMIVSSLFFNISYSSHFVIVGAEREKIIFKTTFCACIVNLLFNFLLIPIIGIYGASVSMLISNSVLFFSKKYFEKKIMTGWGLEKRKD